MKTLVVGGAGYIGSVTVDLLLEEGHEVWVIDSLVSGHKSAVNTEAQLIVADVRDEETLNKIFASTNFDAVIHYGGYIQAGESMLHPDRYFANNVGGVISVLNAMLAYGVSRFVFSSSAAVYGNPEKTPIAEDAAIRPVNPYGESKATVERLLRWYDSQCALRYVSLRYFNASGASKERGEDHRPETHLIPIALQTALGQRSTLPLYGTDYPTADGTCIRDYIHVSDLAQAHVLALNYLMQADGESAVLNLGNGTGFSNREVIKAVSKVSGNKIKLSEEPRRPGDPAVLVASCELAQKKLAWRPKITSLEEIVDSAWQWHQRYRNGYPD